MHKLKYYLFIGLLFCTVGLSVYGQKPWDNGKLIVSSDKRMIQHDNGTAFFWMGCTGWEAIHRLTREEIDIYCQNRAEKKFTIIQVVILPERDGGIEKANVYGDLPLLNKNPTTPNVTAGNNNKDSIEYDYWDHVDYMVQKAADNGLYVAMLPSWGKYVANISTVIFDTVNARTYGRWIGDRYKDNPNIVWIIGGDRAGDYRGTIPVWDAMAEGIKAVDTNHLMTFHPDVNSSSKWFHNKSWLDFNMIQSGHCFTDPSAIYENVTIDYNLMPVKPTIDGEPRYEDISRCFTMDSGRIEAFDVREAAYWSLFAGSFGHTYGHNSIWQMYKSEYSPILDASKYWDEALNDSGAVQMQYLSELMQSRPILERIPDQSLIFSGSGSGANHIQATRGVGYALFYLPSGNTVGVNMGIISGAHTKAWWYNPKTGDATEIGIYLNKGTQIFNPPGNHERKNDWILVLDDIDRNYGEPGVIIKHIMKD